MDKWALITGAASGIGAAMAKILAEDRYNLFLVDKVELKQKEIQDLVLNIYPEVILIPVKIDLTEEDAAGNLYQMVKEKKINLDVLINNAGFGTIGLFNDIEWEREKQMIRLHVETVTQLTKLFLSDMLKKGQGKILNVASVAGYQPSPLMAVYNATKAYILSFSEAVANEVKGSGVTITVLCPGLTRTGFQKSVGVGNPNFTKNKWFSDGADRVAKSGISAMNAGKSVVIPGILNKLLITIQRFLPRSLITILVRKIQEKNRRGLISGNNKLTLNQ